MNVIGIVMIKPANGAISDGILNHCTNTYNNTVCIPILTTCVKGKLINLRSVGLTLYTK